MNPLAPTLPPPTTPPPGFVPVEAPAPVAYVGNDTQMILDAIKVLREEDLGSLLADMLEVALPFVDVVHPSLISYEHDLAVRAVHIALQVTD